jgi:hypothetical protein
MRLYEREWTIPRQHGGRGLIAHFAASAAAALRPWERAVRFVVSAAEGEDYRCEAGILASEPEQEARALAAFPSIFEFRRRPFEATDRFNVVLLVPTGVNAALGGHAGDAGPVARLFASVADTLITHPNVVN